MAIQLRFNKIYVIQSLSEFEIPTGRNLYDKTIEPNIEFFNLNNDLKAVFLPVHNKKGFIRILNDIGEQAEYNTTHPYLHFEMHGLKEGDGLKFASGDWIDWAELGPLLTRINIKTGNNLFVSVAACLGSHIFKSVNPLVEAPFAGYIGFPDEILPQQLETDWTKYFDKLLETMDFTLAVNVLNSSNPTLDYVYENAIELFERYMRKLYIHYNIASTFWEAHPELAAQIKGYSELIYSLTGTKTPEGAMREAYTRMRATKAGIHGKLENKFMIKTPPRSPE